MWGSGLVMNHAHLEGYVVVPEANLELLASVLVFLRPFGIVFPVPKG